MISAKNGHVIRLEFKSFEVEDHPQCQHDYVEVRDGSTMTSKPLAKFCGAEVPSIVESSSSRLLVRFETDNKTVQTGFKAHYSSRKGKFIYRPFY